MSRRPANVLWIRSIAIVGILVLVTTCSKPKPEAEAAAPSTQEPVASNTPAPEPSPTPTPAASTQPGREPVAAAPAAESAPAPAQPPIASSPETPAPVAEPKAQPSEPATDALKQMQEAEARRVEYEQTLVRLSEERDAAAEALARSQKDLLAFKNPYLARPKLDPKETSQIEGKDGAERSKWAETRVADAQAALDKAQKAYDDAKANPPGR